MTARQPLKPYLQRVWNHTAIEARRADQEISGLATERVHTPLVFVADRQQLEKLRFLVLNRPRRHQLWSSQARSHV